MIKRAVGGENCSYEASEKKQDRGRNLARNPSKAGGGTRSNTVHVVSTGDQCTRLAVSLGLSPADHVPLINPHRRVSEASVM